MVPISKTRNLLMVHLLDDKTYDILSKEEALEEVQRLREEIKSWLKDHEAAIDADSWLFIDGELTSNEDPFGYFYLLYKIHKISSSDDVICAPQDQFACCEEA